MRAALGGISPLLSAPRPVVSEDVGSRKKEQNQLLVVGLPTSIPDDVGDFLK